MRKNSVLSFLLKQLLAADPILFDPPAPTRTCRACGETKVLSKFSVASLKCTACYAADKKAKLAAQEQLEDCCNA